MKQKVFLSIGAVIVVLSLVSANTMYQQSKTNETPKIAETIPIGPFVMFKG